MRNRFDIAAGMLAVAWAFLALWFGYHLLTKPHEHPWIDGALMLWGICWCV